MHYSFDRKRTIQENVRLIARGQLRDALSFIDDPDLDAHATFHEVRKAGKTVRGLLRLVRLVAEDLYDHENVAIRDWGRRISELRDLTANLESVDLLQNRFQTALDGEIFSRPLARRVLAESADGLVARYRTYWDAWQAEPDDFAQADPVIEPGR
jgi:hypothetical protein